MKINKIKCSLIVSSLTLFAFFVFYGNAAALTISPARIEVSGDPGTTVTKDITLFNDSKTAEEKFYVSYSNFEAQGETGSPLFVEPKSDLGTWMKTDVSSIVLAPNETKTVSLKISIPKDAYAGGHFAVVFFGDNPSGGQISVGAKTGTLILLSVNGDVLEAGGLVSFNTLNHKLFYNSLPVSFEYRWKNDGNDRVKPEGNISIHDMLYIPVDHVDANSVSGNVLPHSTRLFNMDWSKAKISDDSKLKTPDNSFFGRVSYQWHNFAMGLYIANLDLTYGSAINHSSKHTFFIVLPWQLMLIMLIILTAVFFVGKIILKKYNKYIIEKARGGISTPSDPSHV